MPTSDESYSDINIHKDDELEDNYDQIGEEFTPFEYSISSYGADYPVDGLVKRLNSGDIYVPPFQRGYVWNFYRASRFIESLLLGLPVPGIFLSREEKTNKLLVIDGQQRLKTLQFYYDGVFEPSGREFRLRNVHHKFDGRAYKNLEDEDRRRLDDAVLHATIIKQDEPSEDHTSVYHIFERLNTGGMLLHPQEIRACVSNGPFSDFLKNLNSFPSWRQIYGQESSRMRDQELILRFFALLDSMDSYSKPMKEFLNNYMARHRWIDDDDANDKSKIFKNTVTIIQEVLGPKALRPSRALKVAVADSVMVGVAKRLQKGPIRNPPSVLKAYENLFTKKTYTDATDQATTNEESVDTRVSLAIDAFSDVK